MKKTTVIKLPSTVKLGSHEYEVLFDETQEDKDFRGTFSSRRHKVYLNPLLVHQQLRVTYLHELVHAICDVNSIGAPEQDVARIAEGVSEVLFRNLGMDFDFGDVKSLERKEKSEGKTKEKKA